MIRKYILHINDSGYERDRMILNYLGKKIPLIDGQNYMEFDVDIDRLSDEQMQKYDELKNWIKIHHPAQYPELPLGCMKMDFKKGWKLEVYE